MYCFIGYVFLPESAESHYNYTGSVLVILFLDKIRTFDAVHELEFTAVFLNLTSKIGRFGVFGTEKYLYTTKQ